VSLAGRQSERIVPRADLEDYGAPILGGACQARVATHVVTFTFVVMWKAKLLGRRQYE
jgi:hypothetical protein